jgi:DNA polymerase-3 subunit alpha
MVTVVLRESGDKNHDARRLRRLHGRLLSAPGKDHFTFMVFERGACYLVEFPNDTTSISPELLQDLIRMVGEENVRVEPIKIQ